MSNGELLPRRAEDLMRDLNTPREKPLEEELNENDLGTLTLVLNDALNGIDIQKAYPRFYLRITKEKALRDAFLEIMEMAESGDGEDDEL